MATHAKLTARIRRNRLGTCPPVVVFVASITLICATAVVSHSQTAPTSSADAPGPLERRAVPIAADNPLPRRGATVLPTYPNEELARGSRGTVTLRVTLDESGRVGELRQPFRPDLSVMTDAENRPVFAPPLGPAFVKSAMTAVAQWRYDAPTRGPVAFYIRLRFEPDRPTGIVWHDSRSPQRGPEFQPVGVPGGVPGGVVGGDIGAPPPPGPPPPPPNAVLRVAGNIAPPTKTKDVKPVYPDIAQSARVQGIVIIEATIGVDGRVTDARVLRSIALLDQAALDAVRQWEFTPTLLNGTPVGIIFTVTVNFALN